MRLVREIGTNPDDKASDRLRNSMEKITRLHANHGHESSWQSRDVNVNKYGGAIKTSDFILSFSGLPEHGDELVCVAAALKFGWLNHDDAMFLFSHSQNDQGLEYLTALETARS